MIFFRRPLPPTTVLTTAILTTAITALLAALVACGDPTYRAPAIVVTFDPYFSPPGSIVTGAYAGIAADVANDTKNAGVKFSCAPAGDCGSFKPSTAPSSDPTCYLAPDAIPQGGTVTVTATSITDPTKSVTSAPITVLAGAPQACP